MTENAIAVQKPSWYDPTLAKLKVLAEKFKLITSTEQLPEARDILNAIADRNKAIKEMLAEPKKKAHEAHKSVTKLEKDLLEPFDELDRVIRKSLSEFASREETARLAREKEQRELAAVVEEMGGFEDADEPVAVVPATKVAVAGLSFRDVPKFKIVDEAAIPRKFLMPNLAAIQALVEQMGERSMQVCPGIEFYVEKIPVRR